MVHKLNKDEINIVSGALELCYCYVKKFYPYKNRHMTYYDAHLLNSKEECINTCCDPEKIGNEDLKNFSWNWAPTNEQETCPSIILFDPKSLTLLIQKQT